MEGGASVRGAAPSRLCLVAALLAAGCGGTPDPAVERVRRARSGEGDVVIAAAWPWAVRKEIRYAEGLEMAAREVNASGGIEGRRIRIARYDDEESIDRGRVVAQQIALDPQVVAVIGHLQSYITVQAANVYDQAGLVLVAPTATDPAMTERGYRRLFRATFTDRSVGRQLADFVAARRLHRVAIYYIRNTYGRNVANAFEARAAKVGLSIVARSSYDPSEQASERTFASTLEEWRSTEMDAIVLAGEVPSAAIFVARARALGLKAVIVGGDAMSSPGLMAVAGEAAQGVIVASFYHPDRPGSEVSRFESAFRQQYGFPADAGSALGYDCVNLLAQAMRRVRSTEPEAVASALRAGPAWKGVTGTFAFDDRGEMVDKPITMSIVDGGRFRYLLEMGERPVALATNR